MIGGVWSARWVTLSAGVTICHVNVSRWGNPPTWGRVHGKFGKTFAWMTSEGFSHDILVITKVISRLEDWFLSGHKKNLERYISQKVFELLFIFYFFYKMYR